MFVCAVLFPLRSKEEWEDARQAITNQPQDSSIAEEFYKVGKWWTSVLCMIYLNVQIYDDLNKESITGFRLMFSVCVCVCVQDRPAITSHRFAEGMKLEAVDPVAPFTISPATVTKVTHSPAQVTHVFVLPLELNYNVLIFFAKESRKLYTFTLIMISRL